MDPRSDFVPAEGAPVLHAMFGQKGSRLVKVSPITQQRILRQTSFQADEAQVGFDVVHERSRGLTLVFSPCARPFHRKSLIRSGSTAGTRKIRGRPVNRRTSS